MQYPYPRVLCGLLFGLWGIGVHAQQVMKPVVVTGETDGYTSTAPDSAANPYRVAPSSREAVQRFTAADIAAINPRDVFDLLNHAAGVLPMYQGRKVPVHLQIRGDTNFAYIVDGAYLGRDTGARILRSLPLGAIEQVEIVRDSTALSLAPMVNFVSPSGAPNDGFVVIRTRRPAASGGQVRALVETDETAGLEGGGAWVGSAGYVAAYGNRYTTAGGDDLYTARRSTTGLVKAGFQGGGASVELLAYRDRGMFQLQRADADTSQASVVNAKWAFDPIETTLLTLNGSMAWNDAHTTLISLYQTELDATLVQQSFANTSRTLNDNEDRTRGVSLRHTWRSGATLVQGGANYVHWETPTGQLFYEGKPREEEIVGGFVQAEQGFFDGALVLDGAYRQDRKKVIKGVDSYGHYSNYANSVIRNREMPKAEFLAFGASWRPLPDWTFSGRYAQGEQAAGLGVRAEIGVELGDERQRKYEVAARYAGWSEGGWGLTPVLTVFRAETDNYKTPTRFDAATQEAVYTQTDSTRTGFELQLSGHYGEGTHWHAGWTRMMKTDVAGDHGRSTPRDLFSLRLGQRIGSWDFNGSVQRVGVFESYFFSKSGVAEEIGDYTRVDLSVARHFKLGSGDASVTVYGRNVGNERYETQLGYEDAGAQWGVAFQMAF